MEDTIVEVSNDGHHMPSVNPDTEMPKLPEVGDLKPHVPLKGLSRLLALAYIHRRRFGVLVGVAVSVAVTLGFVLPHLLAWEATPPVIEESSQQELTLTLPEETKTSEAERKEAMEKKGDVVDIHADEPLRNASAPTEETSETPPEAEEHASRSEPFSSPLSSIDMKDLAHAVDNLGFRIEQAERRLSDVSEDARSKSLDNPPVQEDATSAKVDERAGMSEEDRVVYDRLVAHVEDARKSRDEKALKSAEEELAMFRATLSTEIEFRIAAGPDQRAGFWRSLADDPSTKQYFLVVEAVVAGEVVNWAIRDADTGKVVSTNSFGLHVEEATFAEFAEDLRDNGRIEDTVVGIKPVGRISPVWSVKTDGQSISRTK